MTAFPDSGPPGLDRRALLRAAAVLLVTQAAGPLAACAAGETTGRTARTIYADKEPHVANVLLLHHAQGLTEGIRAFADQLRQAGHTVHTPDLYNGRTFPTLDQGVAHAEKIGFDVIRERGVRSADELLSELVYIGWSLGVLSAQQLAQTRAGARGAVLLEACVPPSVFGTAWPTGVPVQIHGMDADPFFAGEGDIDAARALVQEVEDGELFVYPGDRHLFIDSSLPSYDAPSAELVIQRVLDFLRTS